MSLDKKACVLILGMLSFLSCNTEPDFTNPEDVVINEILPEEFKIDVPDALSFDATLAGGRRLQDIEIKGDDIYNNLRAFIWVGESSTLILEELIDGIFAAQIDSAVSFSIPSDEDGRLKNFELKQRISLNGKSFRFELDMTDEDGAVAAQIYWNTNPVEVVSILSPYNINRNEGESTSEIFYRIDYSEDNSDYDAAMTISITNVPIETGLDNLKMFIGKNDDVVEIFGNSNHPNITLIDPSFTGGRNYAFVARGNTELNVGVAKVALPPSAVDSNEGLFEEFSVLAVFEEELMSVGVTDQDLIDAILINAAAPAFFIGEEGFVSSGLNVPDIPVFNNSFIDLSFLTPFVPRDVRDLNVTFEE